MPGAAPARSAMPGRLARLAGATAAAPGGTLKKEPVNRISGRQGDDTPNYDHIPHGDLLALPPVRGPRVLFVPAHRTFRRSVQAVMAKGRAPASMMLATEPAARNDAGNMSGHILTEHQAGIPDLYPAASGVAAPGAHLNLRSGNKTKRV